MNSLKKFIEKIDQISDEYINKKLEIFKIFQNFFKELQNWQKEHGKDHLKESNTQFKINELIKMSYDPSKMNTELPETTLVDIKPYQTLVLSRNAW